MPFKSAESRNQYMREYRAKKKAESLPVVTVSTIPADPADQIRILSEWAEAHLIIPAGHPLAGEAMVIPDFGQDFLVDALSPGKACYVWPGKMPSLRYVRYWPLAI